VRASARHAGAEHAALFAQAREQGGAFVQQGRRVLRVVGGQLQQGRAPAVRAVVQALQQCVDQGRQLGEADLAVAIAPRQQAGRLRWCRVRLPDGPMRCTGQS